MVSSHSFMLSQLLWELHLCLCCVLVSCLCRFPSHPCCLCPTSPVVLRRQEEAVEDGHQPICIWVGLPFHLFSALGEEVSVKTFPPHLPALTGSTAGRFLGALEAPIDLCVYLFPCCFLVHSSKPCRIGTRFLWDSLYGAAMV